LFCAKGTAVPIVWTKADPLVEGTAALGITQADELALVQITEDGTTEFADTNITVQL